MVRDPAPPHTRPPTSAPRATRDDLLAQIPVPMCTLDGDGHVTWMNAPLRDLLGQEDVIGQPLRLVDARGRVIPARLDEVPLETGALIVVHPPPIDLLEGRLSSAAMLASGLAHQINNPLSYVVTNLRFLMEELPELLGETQHRVRLDEALGALEDAVHGAERVAAIVRDLKVLAQVREPNHGEVDVEAVTDSALSMVLTTVRERARLQTEHRGAPKIRGNAGRLAQVIVDLLHNAVHALPRDRQDNVIRVTTDRAEDWAVIEVSDTGSGIAPEVLPRIFDPFFTTRTGADAVGLGLSMAHAMVVSMGGRIEVSSELDQGSTFRVLLPPLVLSGDASGTFTSTRG